MGSDKKLFKIIYALEDKLIKYRNKIDGRTYASLLRKMYGVRGIKSLEKLLKKYNLGDIDDILSDDNKVVKLQQLKDYGILKEYHINGKAKLTQTFYYTRNGQQKEKSYEVDLPVSEKIQAKSKREAEKLFEEVVTKNSTIEPMRDHDSPNFKSQRVDSVDYDFIDEAPQSASSELTTYMQASQPVIYDFIPNDERYNKNENFCVFDTFVGIYSQYIKKMTRDYFISLCEEVLGLEKFKPSPLDVGCGVEDGYTWSITDNINLLCVENLLHKYNISIRYDHILQWSIDSFIAIYSNKITDFNRESLIEDIKTYYNKPKQIKTIVVHNRWQPEDGVTPQMLNDICKKLNISHYAFDVTKKCFIKYVSTSRNYPALIYYCVNGHMYWVSDKQTALSLANRSKDAITKIKSIVIDEDDFVNIYAEREIVENIDIENLKEHANKIIIYNKPNLNEELDQIIGHYNYIPKVKNNKTSITQINFNLEKMNIILTIDPNDTRLINFKKIKELCDKHKVEFKNQSFGNFIRELKDKFYDSKNIRHHFTKEEREKIFHDNNEKCNICDKKLSAGKYQIDHILPLASGGDNEIENLQILCNPCHFEKTKHEHENGYIKTSPTESSFNSTTRDIFKSELNKKYAFVEKLRNEVPHEFINCDDKKNIINPTIFHIDVNRTRKNLLYYSKYDYPLFTVMDEPVKYKGEKSAGLFYVEFINLIKEKKDEKKYEEFRGKYLPFRGNGWYSLPMIKYGLKKNLIKEENIKYALYSSLTIPHDYYNQFIDYLYNTLGDNAKWSVNAMIGCFNLKARENWSTLCITEDYNNAWAHYLENKSAFVNHRLINDKHYYQVYNKHYVDKQDTEAPIYNQILDLEAIEMHKLISLVRKNQGEVLDVSTDCISCVFKDNKLPFELDDDNINIKGFYFDKQHKFPRYKLEKKEPNYRLKVEILPKYIRSEKYEFTPHNFSIDNDVDTNDFKPLVDKILSSQKSYHIDGRAGCGKSFLIKLLQKELTERKILYQSLAPTNKACRVIDGITIHRFSALNTGSTIRDMKCKYIFIDEVSMMNEHFYKYFIVLKRMRPDVKFIISGDFAQLKPVNERILDCNYKNSIALHELCDGNRLQLTNCRRSDATLFNMLLPENINKIKKREFGNKMTDMHISFTNKKRIEINKLMMDKIIKENPNEKVLELKKLSYDDNSQDVTLLKGMPIIARRNCKEFNIANNECFTIKEINFEDKLIIIEDEQGEGEIKIEFKNFQQYFYVAYCITCHKSQGQTYDHEYTIHEWGKFDETLKYVSLSRATDKELINII